MCATRLILASGSPRRKALLASAGLRFEIIESGIDEALTGGESAPPLTGGPFVSNWEGLTLDILFERIRLSMPSDNPARVGRQPKADILAYMLSMNSFPSGNADLPPKTELLKDILFEATRKPEEKSKQ